MGFFIRLKWNFGGTMIWRPSVRPSVRPLANNNNNNNHHNYWNNTIPVCYSANINVKYMFWFQKPLSGTPQIVPNGDLFILTWTASKDAIEAIGCNLECVVDFTLTLRAPHSLQRKFSSCKYQIIKIVLLAIWLKLSDSHHVNLLLCNLF